MVKWCGKQYFQEVKEYFNSQKERNKKIKIIKEESNKSIRTLFYKLFDKLVPSTGASGNVAGELLRAVNRIEYRFHNDGDKIGVGYGRETCNPPARYILENGSDDMKNLVSSMWSEDRYYETVDDNKYEDYLQKLMKNYIVYVNKNPGLVDEKSADMWSYRNKDEDVDDYPDDEYDEEDEDEEDEDDWG